MPDPLPDGVVYTETVVYTPPERYASEAPYQIGIVELRGGGRITARITGTSAAARAFVGDHVSFLQWRDGVPYFTTTKKEGE